MLRYIEVAGTHRQIGEAIGESIKEEIKKSIELHLGRTKINAAREKNLQRLIKTVKKYFPDFVDEIVGMSKASGVALRDLFIFSFEEELSPGEHCTSLGVKTKNGIIFAHNEDWDLPLPMYVVKAKPRGKPAFLSVANAGQFPGTIAGYNSKGVVFSGNSIDTSFNKAGFPKTYFLRKFLELGSISEVLDFVANSPRTIGNNSLLVSGKEKRIAFLEWSPKDFMLEENDSGLCHTNHFLSPKLKSHQTEKTTPGSMNRFLFAEEKLLKSKNHSLASVKELLKTHFEKGRGICQHRKDWQTICSVIVNTEKGELLVCDGNPCQKAYKKYYI